MKIKLRNKADQHKYDLYQVGHVIVTKEYDVFMVVKITDEHETRYGLSALTTNGNVLGTRDSLKILADEVWEPGDRLMVNPTLVEGVRNEI